jgi:hypothetical protein
VSVVDYDHLIEEAPQNATAQERCSFQLLDAPDSPTCDRPAVAVYVVGWRRYGKCSRHDTALVRATAAADHVQRIDLTATPATPDSWHGWATDNA